MYLKRVILSIFCASLLVAVCANANPAQSCIVSDPGALPAIYVCPLRTSLFGSNCEQAKVKGLVQPVELEIQFPFDVHIDFPVYTISITPLADSSAHAPENVADAVKAVLPAGDDHEIISELGFAQEQLVREFNWKNFKPVLDQLFPLKLPWIMSASGTLASAQELYDKKPEQAANELSRLSEPLSFLNLNDQEVITLMNSLNTYNIRLYDEQQTWTDAQRFAVTAVMKQLVENSPNHLSNFVDKRFLNDDIEPQTWRCASGPYIQLHALPGMHLITVQAIDDKNAISYIGHETFTVTDQDVSNAVVKINLQKRAPAVLLPRPVFPANCFACSLGPF